MKERFTINAYPSLVLVSKGKYYEYKEKRDPESLIKFALEDFLALEGEEIPMEPNFFRSAYKSLGKVLLKNIKLNNCLKYNKNNKGDYYCNGCDFDCHYFMLYLHVHVKRRRGKWRGAARWKRRL